MLGREQGGKGQLVLPLVFSNWRGALWHVLFTELVLESAGGTAECFIHARPLPFS